MGIPVGLNVLESRQESLGPKSFRSWSGFFLNPKNPDPSYLYGNTRPSVHDTPLQGLKTGEYDTLGNNFCAFSRMWKRRVKSVRLWISSRWMAHVRFLAEKLCRGVVIGSPPKKYGLIKGLLTIGWVPLDSHESSVNNRKLVCFRVHIPLFIQKFRLYKTFAKDLK